MRITCSSYCACLGGVSGNTKIDRSLTTLYESWFIVMIWLSACSSVDAVELHGRGAIGELAVEADVDAVRRADGVQDVAQADVVEVQFSGSRDAGLRIGSADAARARSRIAWIAGFGRAASMRSRIVLIELGDLRRGAAVARVVLGWPACIRRAPPRADPAFSNSRALSRCARDAACIARCSADLVGGVVGDGLHGLAVGRDRLVEVAGAHRRVALAERLARRRSRRPAAPAISTPPIFNLKSAI